MTCDPGIVNGLLARIQRQQDWLLLAILGSFFLVAGLVVGLARAITAHREEA